MFERKVQAIVDGLDFDLPFRVVLPNGHVASYRDGPPAFTIVFKTPRSLRDCLFRSTLGFGEAFVRGEIDVEGPLEHVVRLGFAIERQRIPLPLVEKLRYAAGLLARRNTLAGSRRNIAAHYDLSNEFYQLWLDDNMQYTCAYFRSEDDTLEAAQLQKMDLVCRKLRLEPGELVIEAGCGWGGLALHMVRKYGVRVRAYNISKEQIAFARERQRHHGISEDRLQYVLDDYRTIPRHATTCDKFVSICMIEHVGRDSYDTFHRIVADVLKPKGLALIQFISRMRPARFANPWLEKHVFPGYYNPSLVEFISALEDDRRPLHVIDVENLRFHYALTVKHWLRRLEANRANVLKLYGEARGAEIMRRFRLYLSGGYADFSNGMGTLVYQLLLSNGGNNSLPLTRDHLVGTETWPRLVEVRSATG